MSVTNHADPGNHRCPGQVCNSNNSHSAVVHVGSDYLCQSVFLCCDKTPKAINKKRAKVLEDGQFQWSPFGPVAAQHVTVVAVCGREGVLI